jgi:hypothetical protein
MNQVPKGRPLAPQGGNDNVNTPVELAQRIIGHFSPRGTALDPCRGGGAFYDNLKVYCKTDWCEINEGVNFFTAPMPDVRYDWVITNPPWSQMRPFLQKSMQVADNVVFLCLINAFFMKARVRDMLAAEFGMKEILHLATPPKPWPQTGFALGAVHIERGWSGPTKQSFRYI